MRILLDTHILIGLVERRIDAFGKPVARVINAPDAEFYASVISLWEIAIKWRLGKLQIAFEPLTLPELLADMGIKLLVINHHHVLAEVAPEPQTRDPFDRLLLAQSAVEGLKLLTIDRALADHPHAVVL
jgi:PIN domain nuclease of toxin-antitoxin system